MSERAGQVPMSEDQRETHKRYWQTVGRLMHAQGVTGRAMSERTHLNRRVFAHHNGIFPYGEARSDDPEWVGMYAAARPVVAEALGVTEAEVWRLTLEWQLKRQVAPMIERVRHIDESLELLRQELAGVSANTQANQVLLQGIMRGLALELRETWANPVRAATGLFLQDSPTSKIMPG